MISKDLSVCIECMDDYCMTCSQAEHHHDFCSQECEDKNYGPVVEEEL